MNWRGTAQTVLTLLAVTAGAVYLIARVTMLGSGWSLTLSVPLYLAELVAFAQFSLFAFVAWHGHEAAHSVGLRRVSSRSSIVDADVVIDARHADVDALERTLVGIRSMHAVTRTIVVDSSERDDVAEAAHSLGATLVIDGRADHEWLDVLLEVSSNEAIAWLAAGQVPAPDFIRAGCARLDDPSVAVWQSAVGLLNVDSLVHIQRGRDEDAVVRTVIAPGLDSLGAAPWSGPGSIVRRQPLELLGSTTGSPRAAIHDCLTHLHSAGWISAFDELPRVRAIAPDDLDQYLVDRRDRASASLALFLTRRNPLVRSGLTIRQRIAHLTMASLFVTGLRQAVVVLVLIATLLTGQLPFDGPLRFLLPLWIVATATAAMSRRNLANGSMRLGDWTRHGWRTVGADTAAIAGLLFDDTERPSTTRGSNSGLRTLGQLRMLTGVVIALDVALLLRGATILFENFLPAFPVSERLLVVTFGLLALVPMVDVLQLVVSRKQRRKTFRLSAELDVTVGETTARTIDIAVSGVGVLLPDSPTVGSLLRLRLALPGVSGSSNVIHTSAIVRAASLDPSGLVRVGCEFEQLSAENRRSLIEYCMVDNARDGQPAEVTEPQLLTIDRPAENRVHPIRALTAISMVASLGFLFFGPSAASAAETSAQAHTLQVLDTNGTAISGPRLRVYSDETSTWTAIGEVPESGQAEFETSSSTATGTGPHVEVVWAGGRLVLPVRDNDIIINLSRISAGAAQVSEIDTGSGWVPFVDSVEVLPGPVAIRLADGTVSKVDLLPAHVLDVGTGEQTNIDPTSATSTSTSTTTPATPPTTTETTASESPTSESPTSSDAPTTAPATTAPATTTPATATSSIESTSTSESPTSTSGGAPS